MEELKKLAMGLRGEFVDRHAQELRAPIAEKLDARVIGVKKDAALRVVDPYGNGIRHEKEGALLSRSAPQGCAGTPTFRRQQGKKDIGDGDGASEGRVHRVPSGTIPNCSS
jgi:hypothetical protein